MWYGAPMHPRNRHQNRYDLKQLCQDLPELRSHVFTSQYGNATIDFSHPQAVKLLNQAILKSTYGITFWELPEEYLCPPIPGRADYIHHLADLLASSNQNTFPQKVLAWDVGVGANCVYPLIGTTEYHWSFIGSEIDQRAYLSAQNIVVKNNLQNRISLRLQIDKTAIFKNLIRTTDLIDVTLCNPPFHASATEAKKGSDRKNRNLGFKKDVLNFGGKSNELWCDGGEEAFVARIINESEEVANQCLWFTSLVSKKEHLPFLQKKLKNTNIKDFKVIEMEQGQKMGRILAWTYKSAVEQKQWFRLKQ
jgi:23S rRNA (adenine1618-N6)-methyltransferase